MTPDKSTIVRSLMRRAGAAVGTVSPGLAGALGDLLFFRTPPAQTSPRIREALATGRRFAVRVGRRRIVAWSWGHGPAVYLLHGWGGRGGQLGAFVNPLLGAGFSAVALDAPGHGESDGWRSSAPEFARALSAVVAAHAPAHAIVAHSLGAVGATLALAGGLEARAAVFLAPAAGPELYLRRFAEAFGLSPAAAAAMRRRTERRLGLRFEDLDLVRLGPRLSLPLLVIHDHDDAEVPWREGRAIAGSWPGARIVTSYGLGHRRLLRDSEVVRQAVAFLGDEASADAAACATCGEPVARDWDATGRHCASCALEAALYARDSRALAAAV